MVCVCFFVGGGVPERKMDHATCVFFKRLPVSMSTFSSFNLILKGIEYCLK